MATLAKPYTVTNAAQQSEDIDRMLDELYQAIHELETKTEQTTTSAALASAIGLTGPPGYTGDDGEDGSIGVSGPTGPTGPQGIAGPLGRDGDEGDEGSFWPTLPINHVFSSPILANASAGADFAGGGTIRLLNGSNDYTTWIGTEGGSLLFANRALTNAFRFHFGSATNYVQLANDATGFYFIPNGGPALRVQGLNQLVSAAGTALLINTTDTDGGSLGIRLNRDGGSAGNSSIATLLFGLAEKFRFTTSGREGIGQTTPTAQLHIAAGTATAETAPLKLTSGTNLTTPEAGAIEFDGTNLYFTTSTGTRKTITAI